MNTNKLRELHAKATQGRWHLLREHKILGIHSRQEDGSKPCFVTTLDCSPQDALLICLMHNWLPELLDAADKLDEILLFDDH